MCHKLTARVFLFILTLSPVQLASSEAQLILTEQIDFIYLRLYHLIVQIPEDINELRSLLRHELNTSVPYREAWEDGKRIFRERKSSLVTPGVAVPDEYHIALITYTVHDVPNDKPFYSVFNTATRNLCSSLSVDDYPFKSFFQLLRLGINKLKNNPKFAPEENRLYRGVTIRYAFTVGLQVEFQQYTSLSKNRSVSENYSKGITFLIFQNMTGLGIKLELHSKFAEEAEILVSPVDIFEVTKVSLGNGKTYDTFTLKPVSACEAKFKYFKFARSKLLGRCVTMR